MLVIQRVMQHIILFLLHGDAQDKISHHRSYAYHNAIIMSCPTSSAHLINSTRIQDWKNVKDNIEIQFSYKPDKPIIDAFTELQFSVTNLQTGEHMKDFVARVVVTNGRDCSNLKT